jgi:lipoate-protein ligase A
MINTGAASGALNMAVDEAILLALAAGQVGPTLRFYSWRPAAVSIGYFQQAANTIDLVACRTAGVDVVRRLTGGRAVLHAAELTYSITVKEDASAIPKTITGAYRYLCGGLLAGLTQLGISAQMSLPAAAYGQTGKKIATAACFDAPAQYELMVAGRKLGGSAQLRRKGVLLQQGSILLSFAPEKTAAILKVPTRELGKKITDMLARRAISLEEILGTPIGWQVVCEAMSKGFAAALGGRWHWGQLTPPEEALSCQLAAEKYGTDGWNFQR